MTKLNNVEAGSISLPIANGDVTIDMTTIKNFTESLTSASSSMSSISASTYTNGAWLTSASSSMSYDDIYLNDRQLWEERMPSVNEVNAMAGEYPAFAKAYEIFRTAYNLVIDDWNNKDE